jgi:hypothetical protein
MRLDNEGWQECGGGGVGYCPYTGARSSSGIKRRLRSRLELWGPGITLTGVVAMSGWPLAGPPADEGIDGRAAAPPGEGGPGDGELEPLVRPGLEPVDAAEVGGASPPVEEDAPGRAEGPDLRSPGSRGGHEQPVAGARLPHELVAQDEAHRVQGATLAEHLLQGEVSARRHVALGHAAGPRVPAAISQEAVVAEPGDLLLAELPHEGRVLPINRCGRVRLRVRVRVREKREREREKRERERGDSQPQGIPLKGSSQG